MLGIVAVVLACTGPTPTPSEPPPHPLIVGTSGDAPPYAVRRGDRLEGLEIDLSSELGRALARPIEIRDLPWDGLFDALLAHRVDIVMAGVTVTPERETRVAFSEPYLRTTIGALIRREDAERLAKPDAVCKSPYEVGLVTGTVGEQALRQRCSTMVPRLYSKASEAVLELRRHRIAAVAHDGPVLRWLSSELASELMFVPTRIADERVAWAFRRDDEELRSTANAALAAMRADGTLRRVVDRWVPQRGRGRSD